MKLASSKQAFGACGLRFIHLQELCKLRLCASHLKQQAEGRLRELLLAPCPVQQRRRRLRLLALEQVAALLLDPEEHRLVRVEAARALEAGEELGAVKLAVQQETDRG